MGFDPDFTVSVGTPGGNATEYDIYVNGHIRPKGKTGERSDSVEGGFHASGEVAGSWDTYEVRGWVTSISAGPPGASAKLNGEGTSFKEILEYRPERFSHRTGTGDGPPKVEDASGEWDPEPDTSAPVAGSEDRDLNPTYGIVDRPLVSSSDRTLNVGSSAEYGTVQAALNAIPRYVEHELTIQLQPGVHGNEPGNSLNIAGVSVTAAGGRVQIVGNPKRPRQYVIDVKQANFQLIGGTAQDIQLKGVQVKGTVQNRYTPLELDRSVVTADPKRWGTGDTVPIDTYGGHIQAIGTVLEGDEAAVNLVENASISFNSSCEIQVGGPLVTTGQAGGVVDFSGGVSVRCSGHITDGWEPGTAVIRDGHGSTDALEVGPSAVRLG